MSEAPHPSRDVDYVNGTMTWTSKCRSLMGEFSSIPFPVWIYERVAKLEYFTRERSPLDKLLFYMGLGNIVAFLMLGGIYIVKRGWKGTRQDLRDAGREALKVWKSMVATYWTLPTNPDSVSVRILPLFGRSSVKMAALLLVFMGARYLLFGPQAVSFEARFEAGMTWTDIVKAELVFYTVFYIAAWVLVWEVREMVQMCSFFRSLKSKREGAGGTTVWFRDGSGMLWGGVVGESRNLSICIKELCSDAGDVVEKDLTDKSSKRTKKSSLATTLSLFPYLRGIWQKATSRLPPEIRRHFSIPPKSATYRQRLWVLMNRASLKCCVLLAIWLSVHFMIDYFHPGSKHRMKKASVTMVTISMIWNQQVLPVILELLCMFITGWFLIWEARESVRFHLFLLNGVGRLWWKGNEDWEWLFYDGDGGLWADCCCCEECGLDLYFVGKEESVDGGSGPMTTRDHLVNNLSKKTKEDKPPATPPATSSPLPPKDVSLEKSENLDHEFQKEIQNGRLMHKPRPTKHRSVPIVPSTEWTTEWNISPPHEEKEPDPEYRIVEKIRRLNDYYDSDNDWDDEQPDLYDDSDNEGYEIEPESDHGELDPEKKREEELKRLKEETKEGRYRWWFRKEMEVRAREMELQELRKQRKIRSGWSGPWPSWYSGNLREE